VCVHVLDGFLVDVLQEELTELELPADPMEMMFVKLAELKQVRDLCYYNTVAACCATKYF